MFITILSSDQVNSDKNTEINKQSHFKFWFNKNMEMSHIHLAVHILNNTIKQQRKSNRIVSLGFHGIRKGNMKHIKRIFYF